MAKRTLKTTGSPLRLKLEGEVTLPRLGQALSAWTDFLREIGLRVAGTTGRDAVRYVITEAKGGSLTLGVRPQPARPKISPAIMPRIVTTVTSGIRALERSARRPKYFTDSALASLRELALLRGAEIPAVKVSNGSGEAIVLSTRLLAHVDAVLAPELESIGTLEGNLEGLIIHGKRRFLIYDPITGRQITCYFTPRVDWETVLAAFGKRVAVTGVIRARSSGEKVSVTASRLYVFPAEEDLPTASVLLGALTHGGK
jgi:hypothetical protein